MSTFFYMTTPNGGFRKISSRNLEETARTDYAPSEIPTIPTMAGVRKRIDEDYRSYRNKRTGKTFPRKGMADSG